MKGNPYVGPRPYERSDRQNFYGREREARELQALITAEREVLVYAQSGAGKTSLFNAKVIPALEEQGFDVLPVARVGADLPPEINAADVSNVFVFSALLTLAGEEAQPVELLSKSLPVYLKERLLAAAVVGSDGAAGTADYALADDLPVETHPPVLIFDQFEELFTTHRERWQEARGFFEQVRAALDQVAGLGVVFSMREEFLAGLDPYLAYFPARLRARFRLELLGERGALAAITRPAEKAGLPFAPGVAEKLVDDLRRTKVQSPTGEESVLGQVVEPVNLQVVCSQLWTSLPEDKTGPIQWEEVQQYGSVDAALSSFYDMAVLQAASVMRYGQYLPEAPLPPASQRRVREWVAGQLITNVNTRGLALRGEKETADLPNEAVEALEDLHLVRAEVRAGARWYELAHDRLIDPILKSNREWERVRETPMRVTARRWKETGDASLLYRGNALAELKEKVELQAQRPVIGFDMEEGEYDFYEASLAADARFRKRRRQVIATGVGGLLLLVIMAALTIFAFQSRQLAADRLSQVESQRITAVAAQAEAVRQQEEAMRQKNEADAQKAEVERQKNNVEQQKVEAQRQAYQARAREVQSYASAALERGEPNLAALLAMQGIADYGMAGPQRFMAGEQVLRKSLASINGQSLASAPDGITITAISPDGRWMVGQNAHLELLAWDLGAAPNTTSAAPAFSPRRLIKLPYVVNQIEFSRSGRYLVVIDTYDRLRLWDLQPDGFTALSRPPHMFSISGSTPGFTPIGFSSDERWLFTLSASGSLTGWFLQDEDPPSAGETLMKDVSSFSVSPDGRWLAARSFYDSGFTDLYLWDLSRPYTDWQRQRVNRNANAIPALFSPDSRYMVDVGETQLQIWNLTAPNPVVSMRSWALDVPLVQPGSSFNVYLISSDSRWLVLGDPSRQVFLFDLSSPDAPLEPAKILLFAQIGSFYTVAFSPDGCWLAYANDQEDTTLFWLDPDAPAQVSYGLRGRNDQLLMFSPRLAGQPVARTRYLVGSSAGEDHAIRLWDLATLGLLDSDCRYRPKPANDASQPAPASLATATRLEEQVLGGLDQRVSWAGFTPGSQALLARDIQGSLRMWNLLHPQESAAWAVRTMKSGLETIDTQVSPDGRWLVTLSGNYSDDNAPFLIRLWDLSASTAEPRQDWTVSPTVEELRFSADSRWLMVNDADRIRVWSLQDPNLSERAFPVTGGQSYLLPVLSPDGRWLAAANDSSPLALSLWRLDQPADPPVRLAAPVAADGPYPNQFVFSPDGRWLAGYLNTEEVYLWDLDAPEPIQPVNLTVKDNFQSIMLAFDQRSRWLAILRMHNVGEQARLSVIDLSGAAPLEKTTLNTQLSDLGSSVFTLSQDGRWLLFHSLDAPSLEVWDTAALLSGSPRGRVLFAPPPGYQYKATVTYNLSEDMHWFIHWENNTMEAWEIEKLATADDLASIIARPDRKAIVGLNSTFWSYALSSDGRWLAAAQLPKLLLWDITNPAAQPVELLTGISTTAAKVLFSPDNKRIIFQNDRGFGQFTEGRIYTFPLALDELVRLACRQVGRGLTDAEIQQYLQGATPWPVCKP